jgi:hypothetical protein
MRGVGRWPAGLVVAVGVAAFLLTLRFPFVRRRDRPLVPLG